ncbi:MAG: hypothetical protein JRJ15_14580 [Deltaproteobacteria bacterium]|nr:hypothetical protein [Deltaproteobacteria bacterium]
MKLCSKCGKLKKGSEFPKDRTRKDGLHQRCKACKNAYSRKSYKEKQSTKESTAEYGNLKRCSNCGDLKERSAFSKDRTKKDGLYHLCKVCRSAYRHKNKKAKEATRNHGKNAKAGNYDNKDVGVLAIVYAGDACGICSVCGKSLMGYIPGYLHGQPVCKDCVIINMKAMFTKKSIKK